MKQSQNSNVVCVACAISVVFLFGHSVWSAPPKASGTSYTGDAADTLVSEALQREVYGLQVERNELLQGALEKDADHQAARWHLGQVQSTSGSWEDFAKFAQATRDDKLLNEYRALRDKTTDDAAGNLALAQWCGDHGLTDRQQAHLHHVLDFDSEHVGARTALGYRRVGMRWLHADEITDLTEQRSASLAAINKWQPTMQQLANDIVSRDRRRALMAARELDAIDELDAIPAMEWVLIPTSADAAILAISAIAEFPEQQATMALARQAVYAPWANVRYQAIGKLKERPMESYVPDLLATMVSETETSASIVRGRGRRLLCRHVVMQESQDTRQMLIFDTLYRGDPAGNRSVTNRLSIADAQANRRDLEATRRQWNEIASELNSRITEVLCGVSGEKHTSEPQVWWDWWNESNEVSYSGEKPIRYVSFSREVYVPDPTQSGISGTSAPFSASATAATRASYRMDCLAAGTTVWTDRGPLAIEKVESGDLVLSQNPASGELAYKPVIRPTVRPVGPIVRIQLPTRWIDVSGGHAFWVSGSGWEKARQLRSGQLLHGVYGAVPVSRIEAASDDITYNLIVADFHTFFAGEDRVLCHDNTVHQYCDNSVPGLSMQ
ncbi:MAG: polymorphic toxin-type HINT domain-containing protein [Pirellulaceae bacterium]|nr:hypothetical protein [Planctomycetales bacterium]